VEEWPALLIGYARGIMEPKNFFKKKFKNGHSLDSFHSSSQNIRKKGVAI